MRRKQRPQGELAGGDLCELDRAGTASAPEARRQPGGSVGAQQEDDDSGTEPGGCGLSFGKARAKAEPTSKWEKTPRGPPGPGCQGGLSQRASPAASPRRKLLLIGKLESDSVSPQLHHPARLRCPLPIPPPPEAAQGLQAGPPAGWRSSPPGYLSWHHSTVTVDGPRPLVCIHLGAPTCPAPPATRPSCSRCHESPFCHSLRNHTCLLMLSY